MILLSIVSRYNATSQYKLQWNKGQIRPNYWFHSSQPGPNSYLRLPSEIPINFQGLINLCSLLKHIVIKTILCGFC